MFCVLVDVVNGTWFLLVCDICNNCTPCLKKFPDPIIFWHNFIKTTLVSVMLGILRIESLVFLLLN